MSNRIDPATGEAKQFGEKMHQVINEIFPDQYEWWLSRGNGPFILNGNTVVVNQERLIDKTDAQETNVGLRVEYDINTHEMRIKRTDSVSVTKQIDGIDVDYKFTNERLIGRYDMSDRPYDTSDTKELASVCTDIVQNPPTEDSVLPREFDAWKSFSWDDVSVYTPYVLPVAKESVEVRVTTEGNDILKSYVGSHITPVGYRRQTPSFHMWQDGDDCRIDARYKSNRHAIIHASDRDKPITKAQMDAEFNRFKQRVNEQFQDVYASQAIAELNSDEPQL